MMLMSVIGKSEEAVSGAAWGANVMMAMFGGGMVPLAFMPHFMRTISHASPVKWSILALEGAIWREFTLTEMLLPCGVLVGAGTVCLAIGVLVLSQARS
jgi:ABC-2 type transport system permease protein